MAILRFLSLLVALSLIGGCSGDRDKLVSGAPTLDGPYRLDSADQIRIVVFDQAELTNIYRVDQAGYVSLPLIGLVPARSSTIVELQARIRSRLASTVLRNPDVTVEVVQYRPFFVLGEVNNAGQYVYVPNMTVESAIAVAGGYTARAKKRWARLSRTLDGAVFEGKVAITEPIRPGDTIYVHERLF